MSGTRAVCSIIMFHIYVLETFKVTETKEIEAKQPQSDLDLDMWMSSLWSDEGSSEASVTPGAGARVDLGGGSVNRRVKRNKVNDAAGMSFFKMGIMFLEVLQNLWNPPIGRKPMEPARIKFVMRIFKTGGRNFLFPPKNKWSK